MANKLQNTAKQQEIPVQVFNPFAASKKYNYTYFSPAKDLEGMIDSHWSMHWDLSQDSPFKLELASSPYIAMTFTEYGNFVTGIHTGVYSYTISGKGSLYGTLFKPTRFYEMYQKSLSDLTNKEFPLEIVLPSLKGKRIFELTESTSDAAVIEGIENMLRPMMEAGGRTNTLLVDDITTYAIKNPDKSVSEIAKQFHISERTLHQLFHDTVGVGIKWIVTRDRLQKAMFISTKTPEKPNWTTVALELGYSDQSHFINDFKKVIGMSPSRYYRLLNHDK